MKKLSMALGVLLAVATAMPASAKDKKSNPYLDWATKMAKSEIQHFPQLWSSDFAKYQKWDYAPNVVADAMLQLYKTTGDGAYFDYVNNYADAFVNEDGSVNTYNPLDYSLDRINGGKCLMTMYQITKKEKYQKAVRLMRNQLDTQPRTSNGVFWHKQVYPFQVWLDGLYMADPFYTRCIGFFKEPSKKYNDVASQFVFADKVTMDTPTGLNYHGWDESRQQKWANHLSGQSACIWGRSMGWYVMAMVDVLEYYPKGQPFREQIVNNLNRVCSSLVQYQDTASGMWYQVIDKPMQAGNYLESSCTAMFAYAMAKGVRLGVLPEKFGKVAKSAFDGLTKNAIQQNADGTISMMKICSAVGLSGNPYRDGSFEYYTSVPTKENDPKGVGPFIMSALEVAQLK